MRRNKPQAVVYVLVSAVIAVTIWTTIGAPHSSKPVTQQVARNVLW